MFIHTCMHLSLYIHIYTLMYIHIYAYTYMSICVYIYIYIYIRLSIYYICYDVCSEGDPQRAAAAAASLRGPSCRLTDMYKLFKHKLYKHKYITLIYS